MLYTRLCNKAKHHNSGWLNMSNTKYTILTRRIRRDIASARFGRKLPAIRKLTGIYSTGKSTIEKACQLLARNGIVKPSPCGTVINKNHIKAMTEYRIVIFMQEDAWNYASSTGKDIIVTSLLALADMEGIQCSIVTDLDSVKSPSVSYWKSFDAQGFIFLYNRFKRKHLFSLKRSRIPFVTANYFNSKVAVNWIDVDNHAQMEEFILYFLSKGARNIAPLIAPSENSDMIMAEFMKLKEFYELPDGPWREFDVSRELSSEAQAKEYARLFLEQSNFPDAFCCNDGIFLNFFVKALAERGKIFRSDIFPAFFSRQRLSLLKKKYIKYGFVGFGAAIWKKLMLAIFNPEIPTGGTLVKIKRRPNKMILKLLEKITEDGNALYQRVTREKEFLRRNMK